MAEKRAENWHGRKKYLTGEFPVVAKCGKRRTNMIVFVDREPNR
jgi:hypothetical protein